MFTGRTSVSNVIPGRKVPTKKQCMHFQKYYSVCMSYVSVLLWVSKSPVLAIPRVLFEVRGVAHGANGKKTSS